MESVILHHAGSHARISKIVAVLLVYHSPTIFWCTDGR